MANRFDAVVIGSGINGLVAAALLSKGGWSVAVVERNVRAGGAICTSTDLFAGYTVELMSSWHPLFVGGPAYRELEQALAARGLRYLNTAEPTGVSCVDGSAVLATDGKLLAEQMGSLGDLAAWRGMTTQFGDKADLAFGLLGTDFWRPGAMRLGWSAARKLGRRGLVAEGAELLEPAAPWLERTFSSPVTRSLLAPWALHNGLGPDDAGSAFIIKVIAAALSQVGIPVPEGGGVRLVEALVRIVTDAGGEVLLNSDATGIIVDRGRAAGVVLKSGERLRADRAVLASVSPRALYDGLLGGRHAPNDRVDAARAFRHGRAGLQIHLALREPVKWVDSRLDSVAVVHVLDSVDSLSESVNLANRGVLPSRPTLAVGQPATVDPSRVSAGRGLLWVQLQENPRTLREDHAGAIDVSTGWSPEVREAYADRVIERLAPHITNLDEVTDRAVLGPAELEALNANLVGGDPYGGDCRIDQYALWRPLSTGTGHNTGIERLWHIGASTHPGPGLGGGSGFLVASRLLAGSRRSRLSHRRR